MAWTETLGALRDEGAQVQAVCSGGSGHPSTRADLGLMLAAKGPLYSLWNRRFPCRQPGCAGKVRFYATRPGAGVYPTMMWDARSHEAAELDRRWREG